MSQIITATFEEGVLRPDQPLDLPPHARVRLVVETLEETSGTSAQKLNDEWHRPGRKAAWEELERVLDELTIDSGEARPTRDQLYDRD